MNTPHPVSNTSFALPRLLSRLLASLHPMLHSGLRAIVIGGFAIVLWFGSALVAPTAQALTQIPLSDVTYHECPAELSEGAITSGGTSMRANCFIVTGKAKNTSGKPIYNADIFGRIYDANGNSVLENRTRLGSIDEVPLGESDFELRITIPANQPTPLQLEQFKAAGFAGKVRR